jgi:hypothetical protein
MTILMPVPIAAAHGAVEIEFPWSAASSVVEALAGVTATLAGHLALRPAMTATLGDWAGAYRVDFDEVHARLMGTAATLAESARIRTAGVAVAAERANTLQIVANVAHAGHGVDARDGSGPR